MLQVVINQNRNGPTSIKYMKKFQTWPASILPGHQAMDGSLIPPSNVVSLPQRNGPLLPPEKDKLFDTLNQTLRFI